MKRQEYIDSAIEMKKLREKTGKTQEQISLELHSSASTIQKWEQACAKPTPDRLEEIMDAYGVTGIERIPFIIRLYGSKSDIATVGFLFSQIPVLDPLQIAVKSIANEQDRLYLPIDQICVCLRVVEDTRVQLETSAKYLQGNTTHLVDLPTAVVIDRLAEDFGVCVDAQGHYAVDRLNRKLVDLWPLGSMEEGYRIHSCQFDADLTCTEYSERYIEELERPKRSNRKELEKAAEKMLKRAQELYTLRTHVLSALISVCSLI